jgi:transposase
VASDILGKSGRAMLRALIRGERAPEKLAALAEGRLRAKIPALRLALEGHFSDHHRFLVEHLLGHLDELERDIEEIGSRIAEQLRPVLDDARLKRLDVIPGVNRTTIENVIAEIGVDMTVFPDEHHFSSWAGICPGNEESAGKRLAGLVGPARRTSPCGEGRFQVSRTSTDQSVAIADSVDRHFRPVDQAVDCRSSVTG